MRKKENQKYWFQHTYLSKYYSNEAGQNRSTAIKSTKKKWISRRGPWTRNNNILGDLGVQNYIGELSDDDCTNWVEEVMLNTELRRIYDA